jgi:hypothetical protein
MTFEELDKELPNGFHDAKLHDLRIDYVGGSAILRMGLDFGSYDRSNSPDYRIGELRVSGLHFCSIDPPSDDHPYVPHGFALNVAGYPTTLDTFPALEGLSRTFPDGVMCFQFYVHEWNSFINIAAKDVQISWTDEGTPKAE